MASQPAPEPPPSSHAGFHRMVISTDFGDGAQRAVQAGLALAAQVSAEVVLVHVFFIDSFAYATGVYFPFEQLKAAAQTALDKAVVDAKAIYPNVSGLLVDGDPCEGILIAVERSKADLVVVGTHGRDGLPRLLMGSVAEKVLRRSPVPVLSVSPRTAAKA
jgi:nucleotide-binding universal stress UspA family protein